MNRNLKNVISVVLFLVLLASAIMGVSNLLEYKEARKKYTPFFESTTNFDVIFLGTSHMYNHILPMELWNEFGISSYNWGFSNCTPATTYYLLQDIVQYTSPKVVVMDLFGLFEYEYTRNGKYRDDRIEQQHIQFDELPLTLNKIKASQDIFDNYDDNLDFLWNFIMYHNRWNELEQSDFDDSPSTEKGAQFLTGYGSSYSFDPMTFEEKYEPDTVCYSYFLKILEYCERNNITLLCTYIPYAAEKEAQQIAQSIGDTIESYENCYYVDMLYQDVVDFSTDMYIDGHLNYTGACKATSWLGKYLVENFPLDDYSDNADWHKDYEHYLNYKVENLMQQVLLVDHLLLLYGDDFVCELEIYDEALSESKILQQFIDTAGIHSVVNLQDSDYSIKLTVTMAATGENIFERYFSHNKSQIFSIDNVTLVTD